LSFDIILNLQHQFVSLSNSS